MVKIERCPIPPSSLAVEEKKLRGSYCEPDVVQQLKEDSNDKCYICEMQGLADPEVEHLRPHNNRKIRERVFDWNNLFYACPHCNKMKMAGYYADKILDCCEIDPEKVLDHIFVEGHVKIHNKTDDENVKLTADLIYSCFEKKNTGIREAACQHRIEGLSTAMNVLYKTLIKYKQNPESKRYQNSLRTMLSRKSKFAAFKRYYVREHIEDYPNLQQYVEI